MTRQRPARPTWTARSGPASFLRTALIVLGLAAPLGPPAAAQQPPAPAAPKESPPVSAPGATPLPGRPTLRPRSGPVPPCSFAHWAGAPPDRAALERSGRSWRIVGPEGPPVTDDFQPARLTLFTDSRGLVVRVECW